MVTKSKVLMSVVSFVCVLSALPAAADDCAHRIHFLPVIEPMEGDDGEITNLNMAAKVQYDIAQYLKKRQDLPVFSEQVWSDKTMQAATPEFRKSAKEAQDHFPKGLPESFELLTKEQKILLVTAGADTMSLVLGTTPLLRRTMEDETVAQAHFEKVQALYEKNPNAKEPSPEIASLLFEKRDSMALDQINRFFAANPAQKDAIVVFGMDHRGSFELQRDKFPVRCILTPFEFQSLKDPDDETEALETNTAPTKIAPHLAR